MTAVESWKLHRWREAFAKRKWFPVTDSELDAPDGAIVDGYERIGDRWVLVVAVADLVRGRGSR